ncbi:hypothetical protein [Streptomyces lydicus]|uniref:hypothetical protein n=1 Tax=Streptomyces lydicus TaxID=47763 RepID=UPI0037A0636A
MTAHRVLKEADYFARNFRTIQVLIDRESILTGATHQATNSPGSTKAWASALQIETDARRFGEAR